jgi:hypothetical protein
VSNEFDVLPRDQNIDTPPVMTHVHVGLGIIQRTDPNEVSVIQVAVAKDEWFPRSCACRRCPSLDRIQISVS